MKKTGNLSTEAMVNNKNSFKSWLLIKMVDFKDTFTTFMIQQTMKNRLDINFICLEEKGQPIRGPTAE